MAGNSASDLSRLTDRCRIALWVHGHVHHAVALQRPGGTRIVCNAAGPGFGDLQFRENLVVEVRGRSKRTATAVDDTNDGAGPVSAR